MLNGILYFYVFSDKTNICKNILYVILLIEKKYIVIMNKKIFYFIFISIISCIIIFFTYIFIKPINKSFSDSCPFCNEQILNKQKFYEDELIAVLCTHKPIVTTHFLIIPKRHVERLERLSQIEFSHMLKIIEKVNKASAEVFQTTSYFIHQKNGREVGQSVPHVHIHFIAKKSGDNSSIKFLMQLIKAYLSKPISPDKMQKTIEKMKIAIEFQDK